MKLTYTAQQGISSKALNRFRAPPFLAITIIEGCQRSIGSVFRWRHAAATESGLAIFDHGTAYLERADIGNSDLDAAVSFNAAN